MNNKIITLLKTLCSLTNEINSKQINYNDEMELLNQKVKDARFNLMSNLGINNYFCFNDVKIIKEHQIKIDTKSIHKVIIGIDEVVPLYIPNKNKAIKEIFRPIDINAFHNTIYILLNDEADDDSIL